MTSVTRVRPPLGRRLAAALAAASIAAACEGGGKDTVQVGYRGVGEELNYDRSEHAKLVAANQVPEPLPPAGPAPPVQWQNVQVLGDVSATEMTRTMIAMSQWVAGSAQNCSYCHVGTDFASDSLYTKRVSRQMLLMTRRINASWPAHVKTTGVTCYTCHRGQPVPAGVWFHTDASQWQRYFLDRDDVRVQSATALPTDENRSSIKQTENTYALMIGMSKALGVNCTYCHNSRSWSTWQNAPPARVTALYGARMTRELNTDWLIPITGEFPDVRKGPLGDVAKVQCVTCHQGVWKPLLGASMVKDYPALWGHPGPWGIPTPADTGSAGIIDLRGADSIPTDASPRLPPLAPRSRPAPSNRTGATTGAGAATGTGPGGGGARP